MRLFRRVKNGRQREIWLLGRCVCRYQTKPKGHPSEIHGENPGVPRIVPRGIRVLVYGTGNSIEIDPSSSFAGTIMIGSRECPAQDCRVVIGPRVLANSCDIVLMEDGSEVTIGADSLISGGVHMWCSDTHSLLAEDGRLLNRGHFIRVGCHVWIGMNVLIGKNVEIAADAVIGMGAVVTRSCSTPFGIYGGNPAKQLKSDVRWSVARPMMVLRDGGAA